MLASSAARVLCLRVGVRVGNSEWKKGRFDGGRFSMSLGTVAAQSLFLHEPGAAVPEGGSWDWAGWVWARVSAFRLKSAFTSIRLFCSSTRIRS